MEQVTVLIYVHGYPQFFEEEAVKLIIDVLLCQYARSIQVNHLRLLFRKRGIREVAWVMNIVAWSVHLNHEIRSYLQVSLEDAVNISF
jgi:hypothetical protein